MRPATAAGDGVPLFDGVFLGGFECSCHKLATGRRLDLVRATRHDELADADFARLRSAGITACREGVPWPFVDRAGQHDFSRMLPLVLAARKHRIQVVWDLMHFGFPDDVDVFAPGFPARFARHARAFVRWLSRETDGATIIAPINEISFFAWAAGEVCYMHPFAEGRGAELKTQLVRATIEAIEAIRAEAPAARFLQPEPVIRVFPDDDRSESRRLAEVENLSQYETWDMLSGRARPELGGRPEYLDIIGVNFYPHNQFTIERATIERADPRYEPFSRILLEVWARYRRPMLVSETGTEGAERAPWLAYVVGECVAAMDEGCELHGVTLYPIVNHPGWLDDRHCENGLWNYADPAGHRPLCEPLLRAMRAGEGRLARARAGALRLAGAPPLRPASHG